MPKPEAPPARDGAEERALIVAWLRADCEHPRCTPCRERRAIREAIERGDHAAPPHNPQEDER